MHANVKKYVHINQLCIILLNEAFNLIDVDFFGRNGGM